MSVNSMEYRPEAKLGGDHLMLKVLSIVGTYYGGVDCVGISTAGQVNSEEGRIIFANEISTTIRAPKSKR